MPVRHLPDIALAQLRRALTALVQSNDIQRRSGRRLVILDGRIADCEHAINSALQSNLFHHGLVHSQTMGHSYPAGCQTDGMGSELSIGEHDSGVDLGHGSGRTRRQEDERRGFVEDGISVNGVKVFQGVICRGKSDVAMHHLDGFLTREQKRFFQQLLCFFEHAFQLILKPFY